MNKKIAIIHRSEILRKGLNAIIKNFFNVDFFHFEEIQELTHNLELQNSIQVLLIEIEGFSNIDLLNNLKADTNIKVIGINSNEENKSKIFQFYSVINTNDSSQRIHEIISESLKSENPEDKEQEGEELTQREKDVLKLVALGNSNKDIAEKLFISIHTVISHRKNTTEKLGIKSISGLTVYAILNKLIDTDNLNPENLI